MAIQQDRTTPKSPLDDRVPAEVSFNCVLGTVPGNIGGAIFTLFHQSDFQKLLNLWPTFCI